jgi:dTMP kinase
MNLHYLAFEGIDGCGKHEQIMLLADALTREGITPIELLEPSYGRYGRELRRRLRTAELGSSSELRELFTKDRQDHVRTKVAPLLSLARSHQGFAILQSRTFLSAAAYQGESDDPDHLALIVAEQRSFAPDPDLILILDLSVDAALDRLDRVHRRDAMETVDTLTRARRRYLSLAQIQPNCVVIDARGSRREVAGRVGAAIRQREETGGFDQ